MWLTVNNNRWPTYALTRSKKSGITSRMVHNPRDGLSRCWVMNGSTHSSHTTSTSKVSYMVWYPAGAPTILIFILSLPSHTELGLPRMSQDIKYRGHFPSPNSDYTTSTSRVSHMALGPSWSSFCYSQLIQEVRDWPEYHRIKIAGGIFLPLTSIIINSPL